MRKNLYFAAAVVGLATLVADQKPASAATATANLAVTATVPTNCTIAAGTLAFGSYDPLVAQKTTALASTGTFTVSCTKGTVYTVALDVGANSTHATGTTRAMASGTNYLSYEIYTDSAHTTVWNTTNTMGGTSASKGTVYTMTAYGQIAAGIDAATGSYTDTVTETVTF